MNIEVALCINNKDYEISLESRKLYRIIKDNSINDMIRIIDESQEDYLYPINRFIKIELPINIYKSLF